MVTVISSVLVLGRRTGAHREDCLNVAICFAVPLKMVTVIDSDLTYLIINATREAVDIYYISESK